MTMAALATLENYTSLTDVALPVACDSSTTMQPAETIPAMDRSPGQSIEMFQDSAQVEQSRGAGGEARRSR